MGQTSSHLNLCAALREMLLRVVGPSSTVGTDHFVYWDAANATTKCAPDAFVKLGVPHAPIDSWKTWETGTPELCIEIVSPIDAEVLTRDEKLERFHAMGVREVVFFDRMAAPGTRLRMWDRVDGDLVERVVHGDCSPCLTLGLVFQVDAVDDEPVGLRLTGASGARIPTNREAQRTAEARVAELEAELARARGER